MDSVLTVLTATFRDYQDEIDTIFTWLLIFLIPTVLITLWRHRYNHLLLSIVLILVDIAAVIICFTLSSAVLAVIWLVIYFAIRLLLSKMIKLKRSY